MQKENKPKKEKDTALKETMLQVLFCVIFSLPLLTYKINQNDFAKLKNEYKTPMSEKIDSLEIFKHF